MSRKAHKTARRPSVMPPAGQKRVGRSGAPTHFFFAALRAAGRSVGRPDPDFSSPRCARRVGRSGEPSRDRENLKKRVGRRERREHIQLRTALAASGVLVLHFLAAIGVLVFHFLAARVFFRSVTVC